jgi:hypothetical protein
MNVLIENRNEMAKRFNCEIEPNRMLIGNERGREERMDELEQSAKSDGQNLDCLTANSGPQKEEKNGESDNLDADE